MATDYYVDSRNGNDSSDGLAWVTAKKTFNAMWLAAADTVTSEVDPNKMYLAGVFSETMNTSSGLFGEYWEFHATGFAIFDVDFVLDYAYQCPPNTGVNTFKLYGFEFRGSRSECVKDQKAFSSEFYDCVFDGQSISPWGFKRTDYHDAPSFYRCTFKNFTTSAMDLRANNPYFSMSEVYNCTIVGNPIGIELSCTGALYTYWTDFQNCIFRTNTSHIKTTGTTANNEVSGSNSVGPSASGSTFTFNNNDMDFSSGNVIAFNNSDVLTTFTSLATWAVLQNAGTAAGSQNAPDNQSISADPKFIDEPRELYGLAPDSACLTNGALAVGSLIQGAWENYPMEGISATRNASLWTGATLTNCEISSNNIVLSSGQTEGTAVFTYDFGAQREIKRLDFSFLYGWDTSILDYDESDTLPETWSFRVRTAPDAVPTWGAYVEKDWLSDLNLSNVYVLGIEVTLRNDA